METKIALAKSIYHLVLIVGAAKIDRTTNYFLKFRPLDFKKPKSERENNIQ